MKPSKISILPILACIIPSIGIANEYETEPKYEYTENSDIQNTAPKSMRFFIGLNTPLLTYTNAKLTCTDEKVTSIEYEETDNDIKVNYNVFENASFVFGLDIDNDFRLSFLVRHNNNKININDSKTKTTNTNLGLALDIPFTKEEITSPFIRLGMEHIRHSYDSMEIKGFGYIVGLGVTHNFTNNLFGTLSANYEFAQPDIDISGTTLSYKYKENQFSLTIGLGYRF